MNLFPDNPKARALSKQTVFFDDYLQHIGYRPGNLDRHAIVHGHCHRKALDTMDATEEILSRMGVKAEVLDSGCCGMAGSFGFEEDKYDVSMKIGDLKLRGMRELHWYPNADEWQYYIEGDARMTVVGTGARARTMDFHTGDVGYIEKTLPHYIENTGDGDLRFLELFWSDRFEDLSLCEWLRHTPPELVMAHLGVDKQTYNAMRKEKTPVLPGTPG